MSEDPELPKSVWKDSSTVECPNCGAAVPQGDLFCGACGAPLAAPSDQAADALASRGPATAATLAAGSTTAVTSNQGRFRWPILATLLLGVCALCAAGGTAIYLIRPGVVVREVGILMDEATATLAPTPAPTATATPPPTPTPRPEVISLAFAPQVDGDGNPIDATDTYLPGAPQVYAVFGYRGFWGVDEYEAVYYHDGWVDESVDLALPGEESGKTWVRRYDTSGLAPGEYTLELYVRDELLAKAAFTVSGMKATLVEAFDEDTGGWSTADTDISRVWQEESEQHILLKQGGWTHYAIYRQESEDWFADVVLEVDAQAVELPDEGGEYGLLTRRLDKDYYRFVVSASGYYKVQMHAGEEWKVLSDWTSSEAIKQGAGVVNHLRVECVGSILRFYVNGTLLDRVEDRSYITGQIGLAAGAYEDGGGVHVAFDNLVVYRLP